MTRSVEIVLRALVIVGLAVQAVVHLQLASNYQLAAPGGIGEGNLFRIEAGLAIVVGLYLAWRGSRLAYLASAAVALGGLGAVLLYRYVDVGAIGPIPSMYEPLWFGKKTFSAVAEGVGGALALAGVVVTGRRHRA